MDTSSSTASVGATSVANTDQSIADMQASAEQQMRLSRVSTQLQGMISAQQQASALAIGMYQAADEMANGQASGNKSNAQALGRLMG